MTVNVTGEFGFSVAVSGVTLKICIEESTPVERVIGFVQKSVIELFIVLHTVKDFSPLRVMNSWKPKSSSSTWKDTIG